MKEKTVQGIRYFRHISVQVLTELLQDQEFALRVVSGKLSE